jgi:hypothetical protein
MVLMSEPFTSILAVGGKSNSLGRAGEVVAMVAADQTRLEELYLCLFEEDAWLRMRAADSLEKVCRVHPEWLTSYTERLFTEVATSSQPSIQWHLAQIFAEIALTPTQKQRAIKWLEERLRDKNVDWIVAANVMKTLVQFTKEGSIAKNDAIRLIEAQLTHHSSSVRKKATKLLTQLELL